ncbi:FecR family protein [Reichenbachiella versicolor]|uniref:FecR family protein n=1 Tax=Reichenbachiella versicolor TaxID=1821036 RepID=UPI000D6E6ED6|nr:FecR domain-containing protein [Reichenbachiella versicolor]
MENKDNQDRVKRSIHNILVGKHDDSDLNLANEWYHSQNELVDPSELETLKSTIGSKILKRLHDDIEVLEKQRINRTKRRWVLGKIAALIVIVTSVYFSYHQDLMEKIFTAIAYKSYSNSTSERSFHQLPDGTQVWLNSSSSISFKNKLDEESREIELVGEAFFDVKRDENRPFIIHTDNVFTTVLGTSFNISAQPDKNIEIAVATGVVQVDVMSKGGGEEIVDQEILTPNHKAQYNPTTGQLIQSKADMGIQLAWKADTLVFNNTSLQKAFVMISKKYMVDIELAESGHSDCAINGEYGDDSLENILDAISFSIGFDYEYVSKNEIVITKISCH